MTQRVPQIVSQSKLYLQLKVPSKSKPNSTRTIEYKPSGDSVCDCPGDYWFKVRGLEYDKMCRHHRMTTIEEAQGDPKVFLDEAWRLVNDRSKALYAVLAYMKCMQPEHRSNRIHCEGCPLYPITCNIHKITYKYKGRNKSPLIWRLQTAIYNGRRKDARLLLTQIRARIRRI